MGKHDVRLATSSEEFLQSKIKSLEERAAFAEETCRQLRETIARLQKWNSELETAALEKVEEKDAQIEKLQRAMSKMAEEIYGR